MCVDGIRSRLKRFNGGSTMFCIMYQVKSNEIFVFHYNLLLLGSIWSNPVFKLLSFFLSDRRTSNSTRFDLRRCISGWEASAPEQYPDAHFLRHDPFSLLHSQVPHSLTRTSALLFAFGYTIPFTCAR